MHLRSECGGTPATAWQRPGANTGRTARERWIPLHCNHCVPAGRARSGGKQTVLRKWCARVGRPRIRPGMHREAIKHRDIQRVAAIIAQPHRAEKIACRPFTQFNACLHNLTGRGATILSKRHLPSHRFPARFPARGTGCPASAEKPAAP
jgi:hypothetical protein